MTEEQPDPDRTEEQSRHDRELLELLNELRVALPGVQVLFAFLLAVPFTSRFEKLDAVQKAIFTATVVTTALAAACLIAPSAQHRLLWRRHDKGRLLRVANRLAIAGSALLAISMTAVVWFVVAFVYGGAWAAALTSLAAAAFLVFWYVIPIVILLRHRRDDTDDP
jgi:O-antigen/teichoic acid export membrane protein